MRWFEPCCMRDIPLYETYVISNVHHSELAREIGTNNVRFLNCAL